MLSIDLIDVITSKIQRIYATITDRKKSFLSGVYILSTSTLPMMGIRITTFDKETRIRGRPRTWMCHVTENTYQEFVYVPPRNLLPIGWKSSLRSLLHTPFSSLLGPNICLRILFSNTLSLHSSLNVRDHVSQPYSTTGNIIVLIFKFLERIIIIVNNF